jgi:hypothetical protein
MQDGLKEHHARQKTQLDEMTGFIAAHPRLVEATRIQSTNNRITHEKFGAPYRAMLRMLPWRDQGYLQIKFVGTRSTDPMSL